MPEPTRGSKLTMFTRDMVDRVAGIFGQSSQTTQTTQPVLSGASVERREPWFGPGRPIAAQAPAQDVAGRAWDYPTTYNVGVQTRQYEGISFEQLEALADASDYVRLAIETRKDQMAKLEWSILPKISQEEEVRGKPDGRCVEVEQFLQYPDGRLPWLAWQRLLVEEQCVTDAASIYVRRDLGGKPYSLEVVAGKTIKPILDVTGRQPISPAAAYAQILKGVPAIYYTADELIYAPRNLRPGRVYGQSPVQQILMTVNISIRREISKLAVYCYSDDTEVMTRRGWIRFADALPDDEFATRQIGSGKFEWQKAYETFYRHYEGDMIHFTNRSLDLLVTPEHRMLLNKLPEKFGRVQGVREHVVRAHELLDVNSHNIGMPQTSVWEGEEIGPVYFGIPGSRRSRGVTMSGDDYCAFMGMYLAEGNLHHKGSIAISQPKDDARGAYKVFRALIDRVIGYGVCYSGHQIEFCRTELAAHLRQFGKAHEKFIPESILGATKRQLQIFWDYYYLGDGVERKLEPIVIGGVVRNGGKLYRQKRCVFTVSKRLADGLTEVIQKLGMASSVWTRKAGPGHVQGRIVRARVGYSITARAAKATKAWKVEVVPYEGNIACVCVPNKFLYVRRNGKAVWSGNTEGNVPEALVSVPADWPPEVIARFQAHWDAMLSDVNNRRRLKFVPGNMTFQRTMPESALTDNTDEWLLRVITYCFSLPSTAFVKQMNRATAESAYETSLEEGLQPMMLWFKGIMDRIVQRVFGYEDLEFAWDAIDKVDPAEQQQRDLAMIQVGVKSIDEVRAGMGLAPIGMTHAIWGIGPNGIIFVDDLLKAKQDGLLAIQPPPPPMMPGMPPPGSPGFLDGSGQPMLGGPAPQQALPAPPLQIAGPQAPSDGITTPPGGIDLSGIPASLLAAVGLGPAGAAGRTVDVTDKDEFRSDPLSRHVAHPQVLKTLRSAERQHKKVA